MSTSELNEITNISSCGESARAISRTVCNACCSLCRMLPLQSTRTPTLIGTRRSCEKNETFCSTPSSKHLKIVDFQAIHILSALVEHRGRDIHELNLDVQTIARILSTWRCRLLRGRLLSGRL